MREGEDKGVGAGGVRGGWGWWLARGITRDGHRLTGQVASGCDGVRGPLPLLFAPAALPLLGMVVVVVGVEVWEGGGGG